jgi:hypothetical protein
MYTFYASTQPALSHSVTLMVNTHQYAAIVMINPEFCVFLKWRMNELNESTRKLGKNWNGRLRKGYIPETVLVHVIQMYMPIHMHICIQWYVIRLSRCLGHAKHVFTCLHMYMQYICMFMCMVCMCVCIHIYTYTYTHTYIYMPPLQHRDGRLECLLFLWVPLEMIHLRLSSPAFCEHVYAYGQGIFFF